MSGRYQSRITWFLETRYLKYLDRIDGEPIEFEWKTFPVFTTLGILDAIQKMMTESKCEPEQFKRKDHLHVNVQGSALTGTRVCIFIRVWGRKAPPAQVFFLLELMDNAES